MKYINSDIIIAEVKNKLSSWFDSNKADESILYQRIRRCLSDIKLNDLPTKPTVLEVNNYTADLPKDFKYLCLALGCTPQLATNELERYNETINTEERHVCELNLCESVCDVCKDDCGNMYKIVQTFNRYPSKRVWNSFDVLCIGKESIPMCTKDCFNFGSLSGNEIQIKNNKIYTSFEEGLIYIEYITLLENSEGYMIPDNEKIIDWIKADLVHEVLQTLYLNGEPDILQRVQMASRDLSTKWINARVIIKRQEVHQYYKLANTLIRRFNIPSKAIWDKKILTPRNYLYNA